MKILHNLQDRNKGHTFLHFDCIVSFLAGIVLGLEWRPGRIDPLSHVARALICLEEISILSSQIVLPPP
jgi:hypothetical protein